MSATSPPEIYSRLSLASPMRKKATTTPLPGSPSDRRLLCPWGHVREYRAEMEVVRPLAGEAGGLLEAAAQVAAAGEAPR